MGERYFIAGITPEEQKKIEEKGIDCHILIIKNKQGIVINRSDGDVVKDLLQFEILNKKGTEYEGITELCISETNTKIVKKSWDGNGYQLFREATKEVLGDVARGRVVINVPHGQRMSPADGDDINIFVWSSPYGSVRGEKIEPPSTIWGIKVMCSDNAFLPSGLGISLDDGPYSVAEIVGNNIFIHHDIVHRGSSEEVELYREILSRAIIFLNLSYEEQLQVYAKVKEEWNRVAYINLCSGFIRGKIKELKEQEQNLRTRIGEHRQHLVAYIREEADVKGRLAALTGSCNSSKEKYERDYNALMKIPKVKRIDDISGDGFTVYTDMLYAVDPRTELEHEIGEFKIIINCSAGEKNEIILWLNQTRLVDGHEKKMHAPHVYPRGNGCLGELNSILPDLIAKYDFISLVMLAVQFPETVNLVDDAAGAYVSCWPLSKKGERDKLKQELRSKKREREEKKGENRCSGE